MIVRKNKTKFRRPAHKGSLKARHGAEIRIAVPVPGEVSQFALFGDLRRRHLSNFLTQRTVSAVYPAQRTPKHNSPG